MRNSEAVQDRDQELAMTNQELSDFLEAKGVGASTAYATRIFIPL